MHPSSQQRPTHDEPLLPAWFRRALVVVATLLLCSCSAPVVYGQSCEPAPCEACQTCQTGAPCEVGECGDCQACRLVGPWDEYLCDGGDHGQQAAVRRDESIVGLEDEDTVAHYETCDGRVLVVPSSRVCIYAPRFGAVRQVIHPMGAEQRLFVDAVGDAFSPAEADRAVPPLAAVLDLPPLQNAATRPPSLLLSRQQPTEGVVRLMPAEVRGLVAPYSNLSLVSLGELVMSEGPKVARCSLAAITWTGDQEVQVALSSKGASAVFSAEHPGLIYQLDKPDCPKLRLVKLASTDAAHPGDEVAFTLRYDNVGDVTIDRVVIVDNLTARLAYVDESAESSREADFSTSTNEVGSLLLRWELKERLDPGQGGVLTFRTRVR